MPYASNDDLPASIKALPAAAQTVWRNVFNDRVDAGTAEASARRVAWTAVKNGWEKNDDGEWVEKSESVDRRVSKTDLSFDRIQELIRNALPKDDEGYHTWPREVYDDHVIYARNGQLFSVDYTLDKETETVTIATPTQVEISYRPISKLEPEPVEITSDYMVIKTDDDEQLVFGWASVALNKSGETVTDRQNDEIDIEDLEKAAYDFVLKSRAANDSHVGDDVGALVESIVFTDEKIAKMAGNPDDADYADNLEALQKALPRAWWVGFHIDDSAVYQKIKKGEYAAFSIEGRAVREVLEDAA